MKICEAYAALLDLYVDGELSLEETEGVQAHLDTCPACRAYVDDALAMSAAFPGPEDTEVPEGFAAGVMARIQTEAPPASRKRRKAPWVGVLASLAACCAIVILQQGSSLMGSASETAAYDMAAPATAESAPQGDGGAAPQTPAEGAAARIGQEASEEATEAAMDSAGQDSGSPPAAENSSSKEDTLTEQAGDCWVEGPGGNVIFSCTVYLTASDVGNALDGLEGKPFSTTYELEKGVIGTGYAMDQAAFQHLLRDVLNRPAEVPAENPTTELCCVVVTEG